MIHKLRRKFILITMASVSLVMLLLLGGINVVNYLSVDGDLSRMAQMLLDNRGDMPDFPKQLPDGEPGGRFNPETPYSTRYFVLHYTEDGRLTGSNFKHIAAVSETDAETYLAVALAKGEGESYTGDYKVCVSADGTGQYIAVFLDCQQQLQAVRTFALASLLLGLLCVVLVYVLVLLLSKRAIDPVVKNAEKQRQFITDASHELKTPLTVITTSLKVLEMEVGQQRWIDKAQAQTDKLRDLVGDLVTLSRMDEEKPALHLSNFDLSGAVEETAESFRDFATARGHALELDIPPGLACRGDEYAIRQLVSILLDNGVKYADEGAPIRLSLEQGRRGTILRAANACQALDPAELDKLFDRFYRADKSRSSQTGGFGVGLSIARSIAEAHKGSIRAECPVLGQIQFIVTLK